MTRALPLTFSQMTKKRRSAKATRADQMPMTPTRIKAGDLSVPTICAGDLNGFRNERAAGNRGLAITRLTSL